VTRSPVRIAKRAVTTAVGAFGYEIRRPSYGHEDDPFSVQRRVLQNVREPVIFDVGAHHGQTAERYAGLFPDARIYCFEPFEDSFRELVSRVSGSDRITPIQTALADSTGSRAYYVNKTSSTNSLLPSSAEYSRHIQGSLMTPIATIEVSVTTLDAFCVAKAIDHINVLKLDIQGGELMALRGAGDLLSNAKIDVVYTEVQFAPLYDGQAKFWQLCELLEDFNGYSLYGLYDFNYGRTGALAWADALFLSRDLP
jgi:FkbM family methyltransferase